MTSPVTTAVPAVRDAFLDAVRRAELLNPTQLARAEAVIPHDVKSKAEAARAMVAAGHLTKFQAERLLAGRTDGFLLGPYVILEQVGRGSLGRVYKARHRTMNRLVAIKVLSASLTSTVADREALQREVRATAQLNHPNVVTAYDANELADRYYLVLEYVDGPNLESLVRERGQLPLEEACELVRQIALGLAYAHERGMIHGDVKPTNLLVTRSSLHPGFTVKIADFGIAKLTPSQTPTEGKYHRDWGFVAPEQARELDADGKKADLYSLGAVLYFLLSGRPPSERNGEKVSHHLVVEPARIDQLRPDVHSALVALVNQLLAKDPQVRPNSAAEVADRLVEFLAPAASVINFELPSPHSGQLSFASGQLSGGYTISDSGTCTVTTPSRGESAWEQITDSHRSSDTPVQILTPRAITRSRFSMWRLGGLFTGMLLASVAAITIVAKIMAK